MKNNLSSTRKIAIIGMMSAFCFISNYFSIPIGDISRIHFGNVFCALSGLLLGPVGGGLCSGIGAFFYDLTNPLYAAEAPITFCMKFCLGAVAGLVAGKIRPIPFARMVIASAAGSLTYVVLYLLKSFIKEYYYLRNPIETVMVKLTTKGISSLTNALIAVVVAVILFPIFRKAMQSAHIEE